MATSWKALWRRHSTCTCSAVLRKLPTCLRRRVHPLQEGDTGVPTFGDLICTFSPCRKGLLFFTSSGEFTCRIGHRLPSRRQLESIESPALPWYYVVGFMTVFRLMWSRRAISLWLQQVISTRNVACSRAQDSHIGIEIDSQT